MLVYQRVELGFMQFVAGFYQEQGFKSTMAYGVSFPVDGSNRL